MSQTTPTDYKYILLNPNGVAIIAGTTMKVTELVASYLAYGWSPEELHVQFPHISLSRIYSALSYYWDHQVELDQILHDQISTIEGLRLQNSRSSLRQKIAEHQ